jgi:2-methylcitrate dehydratase PrpD
MDTISGNNAVHLLAEYVRGISFEKLPGSTVEKVKLALLDAVGCGLAGSADQVAETLIATAGLLGEGGQIPLFGRRERLSPRAAALVNGTQIHALELDDTHSFSSVHAAGPVIASALSVCSHEGTHTGRDLIEAIVAGYDLACRTGMAVRGTNPYHRGFHPTGICGPFGAAAAAGKLLRLDTEGYLDAWGITGSMAAGLMAYLQNGAWTKKLHPGWAAQSGVMAAYLAHGGYLGPRDIFSGQYPFPQAYSDHFAAHHLTDELGTRFEVERMSFKRFACCRTIHAPMTAALKLRAGGSWRPEEIEAIHVTIAEEDLDLVVEPLDRKKSPRTAIEAQFSMPFGLALVLVEGDAMPGQYGPGQLADPLILKLSRMFEYSLSDDYTRRRPLHFPCTLRVRMAGQWREASVDAPLGDYTNPLSPEEMVTKFRGLARPVLGEEQAGELERLILSLEGCGDIAALTRLIAP